MLHKIFIVPEAHDYKQNKPENTDTDYEHINKKKQKLSSESYIDLKFRQFSTEV